MYFDDLSSPEASYIFGFVQTDGHHSGSTDKKGKVTIHISEQDKSLLVRMQSLLPCNSSILERVQDTNYKKNHRSVVLSFYDQATRRSLEAAGCPTGRKSDIIGPPLVPFSPRDYLRGVFDGDGSVGITKTGKPFVSLVTKSEHLRNYVLDVIEDVTGKRFDPKRNKRDDVYNISIFNQAAAQFAAYLWQEGDLALDRKMEKAALAAAWVPKAGTESRYGRPTKRWTPDDDAVVESNTDEEAAALLGRTVSSVMNRRFRLRKARGETRTYMKFPKKVEQPNSDDE